MPPGAITVSATCRLSAITTAQHLDHLVDEREERPAHSEVRSGGIERGEQHHGARGLDQRGMRAVELEQRAGAGCRRELADLLEARGGERLTGSRREARQRRM